MVKCVVSGCPNRVASDSRGIFNRPPKRFFNFPKDPTRVKVWLAALRETDKQDPTEQHLICEDHFLPEDISKNGVSSDAIPIMPPCLDGPLGMSGPWGAESSGEEAEEAEEEEEEERWAVGGADVDEDIDDGGGDGAGGGGGEGGGGEGVGGGDAPADVEPPAIDPPQQVSEASEKTPEEKRTPSVSDDQSFDWTQMKSDDAGRASCPLVAVGEQTLGFLEKLHSAAGGPMDIRRLNRNRRLQDIINIMEGICLIERKSAYHVKWIGRCELSSLLARSQQNVEMEKLKLVEDTLDGLIKVCAQQLFDVTDNTENAASAYVTHGDISRLLGLEEQTLIVVKAPEETKLEIPAPTEDSIKVHLKGGKGPITVLTCEIGTEGGDKGGCFLTLEESRVNTAPLHTATS